MVVRNHHEVDRWQVISGRTVSTAEVSPKALQDKGSSDRQRAVAGLSSEISKPTVIISRRTAREILAGGFQQHISVRPQPNFYPLRVDRYPQSDQSPGHQQRRILTRHSCAPGVSLRLYVAANFHPIDRHARGNTPPHNSE